MSNYIYQKETYAIRGCIVAVAKELGNGYLEKVYQEALEIELIEAGIPYEGKPDYRLFIKGEL